jgi:hypothetical protein
MKGENPDGKCWKCQADWIPLDHRGLCIECATQKDHPDELPDDS